MSPLLYAVPVFLGLIFVELLAARWMGRKVYRFHDAITSILVRHGCRNGIAIVAA